jgi:hypothetical protein
MRAPAPGLIDPYRVDPVGVVKRIGVRDHRIERSHLRLPVASRTFMNGVLPRPV